MIMNQFQIQLKKFVSGIEDPYFSKLIILYFVYLFTLVYSFKDGLFYFIIKYYVDTLFFFFL